MTVKTLAIDGQMVSAHEHNTLLEAAQESGIHIPTLCHLDGVGDGGAYRDWETDRKSTRLNSSH